LTVLGQLAVILKGIGCYGTIPLNGPSPFAADIYMDPARADQPVIGHKLKQEQHV